MVRSDRSMRSSAHPMSSKRSPSPNEKAATPPGPPAGDRGDTIIVMATHCRSGPRKVVLGSVARGVVHSSGSPVLVVPPRTAQHVTLGGARRVSVDLRPPTAGTFGPTR
jgi:Universal stress protein family